MSVWPVGEPARAPLGAWLAALFAGAIAPAGALWVAGDTRIAGPIIAVGIMAAGMIAAAAAGRFLVGLVLALINAAFLVLLARANGLPALADPMAGALAASIAGVSFAARGALFARSSGARGWWIALAVLAGEAAVLLTALAAPGAWPGWVLALLPAQWTAIAIESALTGALGPVANAALVALAATAAATLLVTRLWPRRWPYLVMFTTWLGVSAIVWERWQAAL